MPTNTGIVRQLDNLGRIVLPKEFREVLGMEPKNDVEIKIEDDCIKISKFLPTKCLFCGSTDDLRSYHGKLVCTHCRTELGKDE